MAIGTNRSQFPGMPSVETDFHDEDLPDVQIGAMGKKPTAQAPELTPADSERAGRVAALKGAFKTGTDILQRQGEDILKAPDVLAPRLNKHGKPLWRDKYAIKYTPEAYMRLREFQSLKTMAIQSQVESYWKGLHEVSSAMAGVDPKMTPDMNDAIRRARKAQVPSFDPVTGERVDTATLEEQTAESEEEANTRKSMETELLGQGDELNTTLPRDAQGRIDIPQARAHVKQLQAERDLEIENKHDVDYAYAHDVAPPMKANGKVDFQALHPLVMQRMKEEQAKKRGTDIGQYDMGLAKKFGMVPPIGPDGQPDLPELHRRLAALTTESTRDKEVKSIDGQIRSLTTQATAAQKGINPYAPGGTPESLAAQQRYLDLVGQITELDNYRGWLRQQAAGVPSSVRELLTAGAPAAAEAGPPGVQRGPPQKGYWLPDSDPKGAPDLTDEEVQKVMAVAEKNGDDPGAVLEAVARRRKGKP